MSSRARAAVFRLLFLDTEKELHVRELQRRSRLNDSTIRQELKKLVRLDLVKGRKDSNRIYYRASRDHPLYPEIRNLVIKTNGIAEVLGNAMMDERIHIAFVFGSIATGDERGDSDVDLFVIGDIGFRALSERLSDCSEKIEREINPYVMTEDEYEKRIRSEEHFISRVMKSPKIFIVGTENDLETMALQRLAKSPSIQP
ncbi:putative toxin-antitoxin system, toxin component [delta proteobacterium NaphS2]|nr:putative toxin-antitoxin system, toxin component [delta proteobacterium NaphS2]